MSAAKKSAAGPDMGGLGSDWERYEQLRRDAGDDGSESAASGAAGSSGGSRGVGRSPRAAGRRGGRRPAPVAAEAVALTVRVEPEESEEIDLWMVELRQATGQRLSQAEVIRELLTIAREEPLKKRLVKRLRS